MHRRPLKPIALEADGNGFLTFAPPPFDPFAPPPLPVDVIDAGFVPPAPEAPAPDPGMAPTPDFGMAPAPAAPEDLPAPAPDLVPAPELAPPPTAI